MLTFQEFKHSIGNLKCIILKVMEIYMLFDIKCTYWSAANLAVSRL